MLGGRPYGAAAGGNAIGGMHRCFSLNRSRRGRRLVLHVTTTAQLFSGSHQIEACTIARSAGDGVS